MSKFYQPIVVQKANEIIDILEEMNFFRDYEIQNTDYTEMYLKDLLTEKFIKGELDASDNADLEVFDDEEFGEILKRIIAGSILYELKEKGYVNSYEDDNTEETFFLTKEGKKYVDENIVDISKDIDFLNDTNDV